MADNVVTNPGTGGDTVAADDIAGIKYQRIKLALGADGVNDGDVSSSNKLPVVDSQLSDVATQTTLSAINGKITAVNTGAVVVSSGAITETNSGSINNRIGDTADAAVTAGAAGSVTAKLRLVTSQLDSIKTSVASVDGKTTAVDTGAVVVTSSALPTGAATSTKQSDGSQKSQQVDGSGNVIGSQTVTDGGGSTYISGNSAVIAKPADFWPFYNNMSYGGGSIKTDPAGALITRGAVTTDEGTGRTSFFNSSRSISIGSSTFTNGSTTVTGSGFSTLDIHYLDFVKLDADTEASWAQVSYILNDTTIQLFSPYTGTGGTGASSATQFFSSTGTGATLSVASGVLTIALGTNTSATTYVYRPASEGFMISESSFSISQRVANQDIYLETADLPTAAKQFARFHFTGTTNTQVITETGYNASTTPSASEMETNTITLPSGNTSTAHTYRIEIYSEVVLFYIDANLVAKHTKRIPHSSTMGNNVDYFTIRGTNSGAITATSIVVDYIYQKAYDLIDVKAKTYADASTSPGTTPQNAILGAAQYNSTEITATTGQSFALQADSKGRQRQVIMDAAGNSRGVNVTAGNALTVVQANDTGKTLTSKGGSAASSGNNTLISAGTNKLKIYAFSLTTTSTTAVTCIFQSGASGTELWRVVLQAPTGANVGANLSVSPPAYLFTTASATLLNLNLSSAQTVHYSVAYYDEA